MKLKLKLKLKLNEEAWLCGLVSLVKQVRDGERTRETDCTPFQVALQMKVITYTFARQVPDS